jgi:hypothetical protein
VQNAATAVADASFLVTAEVPVGAAPRPRWDGPATVAAGRAGVFPPSIVRFHWFPWRGLGRIELEGRSLVYRRTRRTVGPHRRDLRFERESALVEEGAPSGSSVEARAPLTALLVRLVVRDRASDTIVLAVRVRDRKRLLDLLENRGWEVRRAGRARDRP